MSEIANPVRTVTHQGRILRLSIPCNDYRNQSVDLERNPLLDTQDLNLESNLAIATQSSDIFSDDADDQDMRIICSVADRTQWNQRIREVRERKLQELGVGQISNITYNPPNLTYKPYSTNDNTLLWTGLHTPAVSVDTQTALPLHEPGKHISNPSVQYTALNVHKVSASLTEQIAVLQARHHQVSHSLSEQLGQSKKLSHVKSLSQRELIHQRLNSIVPVLLRKPTRVVSQIESIKEEDNNEEQGDSIDIEVPEPARRRSSTIPQPVVHNPYKLHQHLASNDMSELIPRPHNMFLPNFDQPYQSYAWADEPLDSDFTAANAEEMPAYDEVHVPSYAFQPQLAELPCTYAYKQPDQYYFWPQEFSGSAGYLSDNFASANLDNVYQAHAASGSNFNIRAEEFIPFSQAIVKPNPTSQAIPIVAPNKNSTSQESESVTRVVEAQESEDESSIDPQDHGVFDAYNGFDSGSESSLSGDSMEHSSRTTRSQTELDINDVRVKEFKFPSPEKLSCQTPTRSRTTILNSESPEDRQLVKASIELPPPKMSSTPRPRIFQKSVELEDTELDSIIMDLSVRQAPLNQSPSQSPYSCREESSSAISPSQDGTHPGGQVRGRTPSAKLLLSHEDADVGLLLDAMLSAKLSTVTECLGNLQTHVISIEDQIKKLASPKRDAIAKSIVEPSSSEGLIEVEPINELNAKLLRLEVSELQENKIAAQLREELWSATSEIKRLQSALDRVEPTIDVDGAAATDGDWKAKISLLEGRLLESTTFCSALQTQYSSSELALAKLRKELNEVQHTRDQTAEQLELVNDRYEILQQHMHETAQAIAEEQSKWQETDVAKDARIEELANALAAQSTSDHADSRRSSTISINNDVRMLQFLMDRVKSLEHSSQHLQERHQQELELREARYSHLLSDWRHITQKLAAAESVEDNLRAELVMSTEFSDHLVEELHRSNSVVDTLSMQLRASRPMATLKRSQSDIAIETARTSETILNNLKKDLSYKDLRIAELENLLMTPPDSLERQILSAVSENISPGRPVPVVPSKKRLESSRNEADGKRTAESLSERVKELKRMRISWEAKAPGLIK